MPKRICLIVSSNLYESKRHFTKKLAQAFHRHQIETKIIDLKEKELNSDIAAEIQLFNPDITCSFDNFIPVTKNQFIWDFLQTPHISFLVDPAIYSLELTRSPYSFITCVDRFDCDLLKSYNFERVIFWPHAVEKDISLTHEARTYDTVFLGSCYDYESMRSYWHEELPVILNQVLEDAIDIVLSDKFIPLTDALTTAWETVQRPPPKGEDFELIFSYLDYYTRGRDRVQLIRAITDIPVHVFGELVSDDKVSKLGWSHYLSDQPNVTLHPSVSFSESLNVLQQSKICLNSMPFFKNGSHERVFTGFACGALPLTTDSLFWQECFTDNELLTYKPSQWDHVNEKIKNSLSDESLRHDMVERGRKKTLQNHTWDIRVEQLLSAIAKI